MARSRFLSTPCRILCGSCDSSGCLTVHTLGCWTLFLVKQHAVRFNPHPVKGAGDGNSGARHEQSQDPDTGPAFSSAQAAGPGQRVGAALQRSSTQGSAIASPGTAWLSGQGNPNGTHDLIRGQDDRACTAAPSSKRNIGRTDNRHAPADWISAAHLDAEALPATSPRSSGRCRDGRHCNRRCATPGLG